MREWEWAEAPVIERFKEGTMVKNETDDIEINTNKTESLIVKWLKDHAVVLASVAPQEDQGDLNPLREIVDSSQVVGLGEATHGNKEFFQMKHRLIRFLVEEMGFDTVVMECPEERAKSVDEYIKSKGEDHKEVLKDLTYEVWRTQEVLDLINWLREFNEKSDRKVSFIGCDVNDQTDMSGPERDQRMAGNVFRALEENPDSKMALWAHNAHVSHADTPQFKALGKNLKDKLGDKYMCLGMLFNQGSLSARMGNFETGVFEQQRTQASLKPAPDGTYEHLFHQTEIPLAIVDLRPARSGELFSSWRNNTYGVREVGWAYDPEHEDYLLNRADLTEAFDGVVWIDRVSSSTPL